MNPFHRIFLGVATAGAVAVSSPVWSQGYPSPAQALGVAVYPKGNQSLEKQNHDESACYTAAQQRTGINLAAAPPTPAPAQTQTRGGARGAARGAALGAAIGAIAGNAGAGAGAGAVAGAAGGHRSQTVANQQAEQQAKAQAQQQHAQQVATVRRSFEACMDSKGYSVK